MADTAEKPTETKEQPARKRRLSPSLIVLVTGLLVLLWQREEIAFRFNLMAILRSPMPAATWMRELGERDDHALVMTRRLWESGHLAHRRAVVEFLRGETAKRPHLLTECKDMLLSATHDPDYSLRELLIGGLKRGKVVEWEQMAIAQLSDADPEIKIYAMTHLRIARVTNALPQIGQLLDDPIVQVQAAAAITLGAFHEQQFGVESWMGTTPVGLSEEERTSRKEQTEIALDKARAWWKENGFNSPAESVAEKTAARPLPELEFSTTDHAAFSSVEWRGKPTFVQFFATYCTSCDQVLPEVKELKRELGDRVNIVGVSLDAIPDDHNHFFDAVEVEGHEGHDHGHHHHDGHGHAHHEVDTEEIVTASAKLVAERKLGFEVFYDVTGEATVATDGGEIPVGICLDAEGKLRRRFVGPRSAKSLVAILRSDFPEIFAN